MFNDRGACLGGAVLTDALLPGVVLMATGAWYDPLDAGDPDTLDLHGNPNVVTPDFGTSRLSHGAAPNTCLVQVEAVRDAMPAPRAHLPPAERAR
jgi:biotin/methionine sulfoxide reductase